VNADRDRFDKFTDRARKVLRLAQEEAQHFQHNYIGTEHILLGLVREQEGVAAQVLMSMGVDLRGVRSAVEFIIGRGDRIVLGEVGLTPRAKKVIEFAVDEARSMNHHYIGTEHLLLGLIREGEGIGAGVLQSMGVNLEKVRTSTIRILSRSSDTIIGPSETIQDEQPEGNSGETPIIEPDPVRAAVRRISGQERFDTFTERSRKVLALAREEAERFDHNYIGTEHLLLGLVKEGDGIAAQVLRSMGLDLRKVRESVEFIIGRGDRIVLGPIGLTPRSKKVIELAVDEARQLNHHYIGTEHLLLGLIREGSGIAAGVLESNGIELQRVRSKTLEVLARVQAQRDQQQQQPPPESA
jgi:ATP-dependent Clp protease ATP-binding subunit ClpA